MNLVHSRVISLLVPELMRIVRMVQLFRLSFSWYQ